MNDITPFEYLASDAFGNSLDIASGNLESWYIIDGGFLT